jgi:anti-sigma B factor antagonist
MQLRVEIRAHIAVITVCAEDLDASVADLFKEQFHHQVPDTHTALVDLSNIRFVDSTGLGAILSCFRRQRSTGAGLVLCGLQPAVQNLIRIVNMDRVFWIYASKQLAIEELAPEGCNVAAA